jgi:sugar phosphate isomerase/epimerase
VARQDGLTIAPDERTRCCAELTNFSQREVTVKLRDRIGIDVNRNIRIEDGVEWAAKNSVRFLDFQLDNDTNAVTSFDAKRVSAVRSLREKHDIHIGLHTSSAVNVAEYAPYASAGVDEYLKSYVDVYAKLGAEWIVVHAGYHFTKDKETRMKAGLERLKRIADYAEKKNVWLLLENLNKEPKDAEVHYLAHTLEEWRYYWGLLSSPAVRLSFTVNHAHLVPEGVSGFSDALDFSLVGEVRLADCYRNGNEVHLKPGAGDLDFGDMFRRVEGKGFKGHYTNAFGSLEDRLSARDYLVESARDAGVKVE